MGKLLPIECGGFARGAVGEVDVAAVVEVELRNGAVRKHGHNILLRDVHTVERLRTFLFCEEVEAFRVRRPFVAVHPIVEIFRQHLRRLALSVVNGKAEAVRLIARHTLHAVGNVTAVGRIGRRTVPGFVLRRDVFRRSAFYRHDEEVGIGAGFGVRAAFGSVANLATVWREGIYGTAEREEQFFRARCEVAVGLALRVEHDEVGVESVGVVRPMAVEQTVRKVCLHGTFGTALDPRSIFLSVGSQFGTDACREGNVASVGRNHRGVNAQRIVRKLRALLVGKRVGKHLRLAVDRGDEIEPLAVLSPNGTAALAVGRDVFHRAAVGVHEVNVGSRLVLLQIGSAARVGKLLPVGRHADGVHAFHAVEVFYGERALLGTGGRGYACTKGCGE